MPSRVQSSAVGDQCCHFTSCPVSLFLFIFYRAGNSLYLRLNWHITRGRPKVKISRSAETESTTESGVRLSAEGECLPKVKWYFRPKTKPKPKVDRTRTQSSTLRKRNSSVRDSCCYLKHPIPPSIHAQFGGTPIARQQQQLHADTAVAAPPPRLKRGTSIRF